MIGYLKGTILYKSQQLKKDNHLIIEVAGVGYKVFALNRTLNEARLGDVLEMHIYTQVGEAVLDLYGFSSRDELEFFELLITLQGIGPRSALDILQKAKIDDIRQAVLGGNHELLAKVSGLGPKTAQKIVVGLKDKIGGIDVAAGWSAPYQDALEALVGLGYSAGEARQALESVEGASVEEQVKGALKALSKK